MRGIADEVRRRGAEIVVVGNGSIAQARDFREAEGVDFALYVDPGLAAYRAAGLRRGLFTALNVRTVRAALRARRAGFRQTAVAGDAWQQGGTFVVARGGRVVFAHASETAGEHATPAAVLAALDQV